MVEPVTPARKAVTFSYGSFAVILLATLAIGIVSGFFGGVAASPRVTRPAAHSSQTDTTRAWLGITYVPINASVAASYKLAVSAGALIVGVTPNGPAAKAGLREDDVVTAVDQRTVDENTNITDVIKDKKPEDHVQMTVLRDGATQTIDITLGRLPAGYMGSRGSLQSDDGSGDTTRVVPGN
jgi:S1-C subfamily serine protease